MIIVFKKASWVFWLLAAIGVVLLGAVVILSSSYQGRVNNIRSYTVAAIETKNFQVGLAITATGRVQSATGGDPVNDEAQAQPTRVVLKNATLSLVVKDVQAMVTTVSKMAEEGGGWIVDSNLNRITTTSGDYDRATITIRVPAERFTDTLARIKTDALTVETEEITGQDVTADYVDLSSRVANLEASEAQYRKFMDNAQKTDDVINLQRELERVRGEIEVIRGRLRYYDESAAFSSVSLTLRTETAQRTEPSAVWEPGKTVQDAFAALLDVLKGLVNVVVWSVILILPVTLIVGIPTLLVLRLIRRLWPTEVKKPEDNRE
jgi:hypothetical protein